MSVAAGSQIASPEISFSSGGGLHDSSSVAPVIDIQVGLPADDLRRTRGAGSAVDVNCLEQSGAIVSGVSGESLLDESGSMWNSRRRVGNVLAGTVNSLFFHSDRGGLCCVP